MPTIADAGVTQRYALAASLNQANLGMEAYNLTANPALVQYTNYALASAYAALQPLVSLPGSATVTQGQSAPVASSNGVTRVVGTHRVIDGESAGVLMPAGYAVVLGGQLINVRDSNGLAPIRVNLTVTNGSMNDMTLPSNVKTVTNNSKMSVPVTGVYVSQISAQVVAGKIVGFTLS